MYALPSSYRHPLDRFPDHLHHQTLALNAQKPHLTALALDNSSNNLPVDSQLP